MYNFFFNIEYGKMIPKLRASNITMHEINLVTSRLYANYCMVQIFSLAAVLTNKINVSMYNPGCSVDHFLCTEQFLIGYRRIGTGMSGPGKQYLALSVLPTRPLKVVAGILPDRRPFCHPGFPSQMSSAIAFEGPANKRRESRLH